MENQTPTYQALIGKNPLAMDTTYMGEISQLLQKKGYTIIVLDDDPTGTQTVYDVPVLTRWDLESIAAELKINTPLFYILTNSRSQKEEDAVHIAETIGNNLQQLSDVYGKQMLVISRSDSTLRGHYPSEVIGLERGLQLNGVHFIIPAFFEGGRYTIDDIHWVQQDNTYIPAAETPFAKDPVFGYQSSNLLQWIKEKWRDEMEESSIHSIRLKELRSGNVQALISKINCMSEGQVCIVNAANYTDLQVFCLAILQSSITPVFRTAASFVAVLLAKERKPYLGRDELRKNTHVGGLLIAGSFVPKTTAQLQYLFEHTQVEKLEIEVDKVINASAPNPDKVASFIGDTLQAGKDLVLYTSRQLVQTQSEQENIHIGQTISKYLTDIVKALDIQPGFLIAKGGITSSDIATKGLKVKRALVKGQILPGVPVWALGEESKFPGMSYVVFPGNVGEDESITNAFNILKA